MDQNRAIAALGALAQETRLDLFRLLVTCGQAGLPAGAIAERLGVQPSSLSFQDLDGHELAFIKQRVLSLGKTYEIVRNSEIAAVVKACSSAVGGGSPPQPASAKAIAKTGIEAWMSEARFIGSP